MSCNVAERVSHIHPMNKSEESPRQSAPKLLLEVPSCEEPVTFPLLSPEILIGRLDSVDLVLEDPAVSRVHAKIVKEAGAWILVDLESSTGTLVNGEPIGALENDSQGVRHELRSGDVIEIGSVRMEYRE